VHSGTSLVVLRVPSSGCFSNWRVITILRGALHFEADGNPKSVLLFGSSVILASTFLRLLSLGD
jgi:hypothetical protein